jgi:chemotaxis protein methyltransferase CheR
MVKYFEKQGQVWTMKENIRKMVDFRIMNLAGSWPSLPKFDIIFLRNVLYYFDDETKKTVLNKASRIMKPDGYLFLGATETPVFLNTDFEREKFGRAICYKVRGS